MGNSVIYRPAYDAEVEYLETDGNSYIDTGLKASSELGVLAHIQNSQDVPSFLFGGCDERNNKEFAFIGLSDAGNSIYRFGTGSIDGAKLDADIIYEFDNTQSHNIMEVGNLTYTAPTTTFESSYNLILFGENRRGVRQKSIGVRIYDFKIYNNSTLVRDYIPVRIGSVGYLYDKVTKQLFANKGTGQFILGNDVSNAVIPQQRCVLYFGNQRSVVYERIYEEYEWLCGRNGAYINTNHKLVTIEDKFELKAKGNGSIRNELGLEQNIFGYVENIAFEVTSCFCRLYISSSGIWNANYYEHQANQSDYYGSGSQEVVINSTTELTLEMTADLSENKLIMNGNVITRQSNFLQSNTFGDIYLYTLNGATNYHFNGDVAYFKITDTSSNTKMNLIPCRLLQSIPAILDGNGIARQAGECGMWDKVSGKFYGNVANSGSFTVKGAKCYEEYEWLNSVSGGEYITLADGSNTDPNAYVRTTYKCNYTSRNRDITIGGSENVSNSQSIRIFNISNSTYIDVHKWTNGTQTSYRKIVSGGSSGVERSLYVTLTNWQVDNQSGTVTLGTAFDTDYDYQATRLLFPNNSYAYKRTQMRTNNKEFDLIPCKLTHGIPASMDANGIARPAGTCGMWDKVNDKFYGNVANSGTFTVSN